MEELLKDEKSKEILKSFIHEYIIENLRVEVLRYQSGSVDITVKLKDEFVCSADA